MTVIPGHENPQAAGWTAQNAFSATKDPGFSSGSGSASTKNSLLGERPLTAGKFQNTGGQQYPPNTGGTARGRLVATCTMGDLRLVYRFSAAELIPSTPINLKASLEMPDGTIWPAYFSGQRVATITGPQTLISDPLPLDLNAGDVAWSRTQTVGPAGTQYAILQPYRTDATVGTTSGSTTVTDAAAVAGDVGRPISGTGIPTNALISTVNAGTGYTLSVAATATGSISANLGYKTGDTTVKVDKALAVSTGAMTLGGNGGTRETVTVSAWTGSSNPYTVTVSALTTTHASGDWLGQGFFFNALLYGDIGEGFTSADAVDSGTVAVPGVSTTTLTAAAAQGDTSVLLASNAQLNNVISIGGTQYTVLAVTGIGNPYRCYLSSPLAANAASGATVSMVVPSTAQGMVPFLTADRTSNRKSTVVVIGDSIPDGVGYSVRQKTSYIDLAFGTTRPYVKLTLPGEAAFQFVALTASQRRRQLISLGDWCYYQYLVNDIYSGQTLAQWQANTTKILTLAKDRGLKVAVQTATPRTASTDDWKTTTNQTIAAAGFNAVRLQANAWIRAGAGGLADMVVDLADVVETARDSGIWKATGGVPWTADGIHPTQIGHQAMATALAAIDFS